MDLRPTCAWRPRLARLLVLAGLSGLVLPASARPAPGDDPPKKFDGKKTDPKKIDAPIKIDPLLTGKPGVGATHGSWGPVMKWPVNAVHVSLLPNGKVLMWPRGALSRPVGPKGEPAPNQAICFPRIWDPATKTFADASIPGLLGKHVPTPARPPYNIFCSGHSFLADGRLFVAGGHRADGVGEPKACIYDAVHNKWTLTRQMNAGRWYPSCVTLPNGEVLAIAGDIGSGKDNLVPQVFNPTTGRWRNLTNAQDVFEDYPFLHVAPNGHVFIAGTKIQTRYLDTVGEGKLTVVGDHVYRQVRDYGSSVMYEPGKVLVLGGGGGGDPKAKNPIFPTATAEIIDLNESRPRWRKTAPMRFGRRMQNATLLADGTVFVSGGTSSIGFNVGTKAVFATELWDPKTGRWHLLAPQKERRLYHSTAILLPDATVLSAGGGEPDGGPADRPIDIIAANQFYNAHRNAQIFSPPYLFAGPRPVITSAPHSVTYGKQFQVTVPTRDVKKVHRVTLVRLSSTTHAQNFNQRFNELHFHQPTGTAGGHKTPLTVTAPPNHNVAPPGHYMLFILSNQGVPSVAKIIQLK
jgi:hypothetical protein